MRHLKELELLVKQVNEIYNWEPLEDEAPWDTWGRMADAIFSPELYFRIEQLMGPVDYCAEVSEMREEVQAYVKALNATWEECKEDLEEYLNE